MPCFDRVTTETPQGRPKPHWGREIIHRQVGLAGGFAPPHTSTADPHAGSFRRFQPSDRIDKKTPEGSIASEAPFLVLDHTEFLQMLFREE